ncbi:hypothetical protein J8I87_27240 [Paraburkholderia sp. LEh10]|uniref:hypothetical protein n=1 Tax=Paraburkholderia sp. LEh10 TaxID=2821353 RepID=UPI001AE9FEFB|nr:hypothetical protein [Paraburkholderia sp. LEh10]MBP0593332.1 hypothetical protein [Paraburkholderia sp. LEh10]
MNRFDSSTALFVFHWSLAATFGAVSPMCFAAAGEEAVPNAAIEAVVRNVPAPCDRSTTAAVKEPLTLMIQSPSGEAVRLTYAADEGWQTDPGSAVVKQSSGRVEPVSAPQSGAESALDDAAGKPMTVFIDGPTGYTYYWSREQGWKFVGRLTGRVQ